MRTEITNNQTTHRGSCSRCEPGESGECFLCESPICGDCATSVHLPDSGDSQGSNFPTCRPCGKHFQALVTLWYPLAGALNSPFPEA